MIHHRVTGALDDVAVTRCAGLVRYSEIAGIEEPNECGRLVVQDDSRVFGVRAADPEFWKPWLHVCLVKTQTTPRVTAMAIGAPKNHGLRSVHRVRVGRSMAIAAADALGFCFGKRLINLVRSKRAFAGTN
jgi:hypothetical protein